MMSTNYARRWTVLSAAACGIMTFPTMPLRAQILVGTVYEHTSTAPVAGALITLTSLSTHAVVGRALTDLHGQYVLRAPAPGRFTLIVKRIGIRPQTMLADSLAEGERRRIDVVVDDAPASLAPVAVVAGERCGAKAESAVAFGQLLDDIRTAATATVLSGPSTRLLTRYSRTLDPATDEVLAESLSVRSGSYDRPFKSVPPESLATHGFFRENADGTQTYFAPDPETLMSDWFVEAHCFGMIPNATDTLLIGLSFRPRASSEHTDIEGVLWVYRSSGELRGLDARFVGGPMLAAESRFGTHIAFDRLRTGRWVVSRWTIRVPVVVKYRRAILQSTATLGTRSEWRDSLLAIHEEGGFVDSDIAADEWAQGAIEGVVRVPDGGTDPVAVILSGTGRVTTIDSAGRFNFKRVLPGRYRVIAVRGQPGVDGGMIAFTTATVRDSGVSATILKLADDPASVRRMCRLSSDRQTAISIFAIDTTRRQTLPGVPYAIRATRYDRVTDSGATMHTETTTGHTTLDGAASACGLAAVGRAAIVLGGAPDSTAISLGSVHEGRTAVRLAIVPVRSP